MKNEQAVQQINDVNLARCSKGNLSVMVCSSQHCTNKAFICSDDKCDCRSCHQLCVQLSISSLMKIIQAYSFSIEPLIQKIEALFDNAIDKLSDQRDQISKEIKQGFKYPYLGLNPLQSKFIDALKQGTKDHQINCTVVWKLQNQFKGEKRVNQTLNKAVNLIDNIKQNIQKQLSDHSNKLKDFLKKIQQPNGPQHIFEQSKIVKSPEDQKNLLAFFTQKKVESAKILYRASQNDFCTSKWYQKCGNIPNTLTIAQTQFGKVIGGFTSLKWTRNDKYISAINDEKNHFMFSLTNNDKFTITKNSECGIFCSTNNKNGPTFGGGHDLCISTKANENGSSYANIGWTYTNPKYINGNKDSQTKFSGAYKFKIKQWEVWEIEFSL